MKPFSVLGNVPDKEGFSPLERQKFDCKKLLLGNGTISTAWERIQQGALIEIVTSPTNSFLITLNQVLLSHFKILIIKLFVVIV